MYAWPVLFPEQTNREDLLTTVALFDDDTGQAIDLSGRTLAAPGDFTTNAWTVTSGIVVTASGSNITIKDYPFGNEMQAIALNVGVGLNIAAGAPVTIADTATGKNTLTGYVTSYAPATGAMVVQIGVAFDFEIRSKGRHDFDGGYGMSSSDIGSGGSGPIIQAQLGNGLSVVDVGKVQIEIPASVVQKLRHKTYSSAMVLYLGSSTRQVFLGENPFLDGGVSTAPFASPVSNPFGLP